TPLQRTRGPTGGTPSGVVSYTSTTRAGRSGGTAGGVTSRCWSMTSPSGSVLLLSIHFSSSHHLVWAGGLLRHGSLPYCQHAPPWCHPACCCGYTDMGSIAPHHVAPHEGPRGTIERHKHDQLYISLYGNIPLHVVLRAGLDHGVGHFRPRSITRQCH